jgi:cytoskeletal protein RodZ
MTEQPKPMTEYQMTIGNALKEKRLEANLSIEALALKLNLKPTVIDNIENNLEQMVEDKHLPNIYLRGYLANYAKAVHLSDVESYPEYQQLIQPGKSTNTLSNPYMTINTPKSSNKFSWFILFLILIGAAVVALSWDSISARLFTQETIDTENIEMRLPEISEDPLSEDQQSEENLTDQELIIDQATADEQAVLDTLQEEQSTSEIVD